ncbi:MAG: NAD(P)/FAD-dependent oxidoreductase [Bacteroidales bacterium]
MKEVIVIGAGPAGMLAAGTAAEKGAQVILLEKMEKPGRKLAITGKGRCNITNLKNWEDFSPHVHPVNRYFKPAFYHFSSEDTVKFFNDIGLPTVVERGTRVYPASQRAFDVIDALRSWLDRLGVRMICGCQVLEFVTAQTPGTDASPDVPVPDAPANVPVPDAPANVSVPDAPADVPVPDAPGGTLRIMAVRVRDSRGGERLLKADHFILATGGKTYPGTGSTGDGYTLASALGHTIEPLFPTLTALMPVNYDRRLKGVQLRNVELGLYTGEVFRQSEQVLRQSEEGELYFTNLGIEGPIGFRVSRQAVVALEKGQRVSVHLNLKPGLTRSQLMARWKREGGEGLEGGRSKRGNVRAEQTGGAIPGIRSDISEQRTSVYGSGGDLSQRLRAYMPEALIEPFTRYLAQSGLHPVDGMIKWVFPIASYGDWARAVVTAGGISMKEVDIRTMRSKLVENLSFAGEILDLDADSGGYNLQIAFATGRVAGGGTSCAKYTNQ